MTAIVLALTPVFGLIVAGWALRARGVFADGFWDQAERLTFYVLFPALLMSAIGTAAPVGRALLPMVAALVAATVALTVLMVALKAPLQRAGISGAAFVSVFQGAIRPNTYVGIAAAFALFGTEGLALVAAAIVAVIPLVNVLAIIAHERWAPAEGDGAPSWPRAFVEAARNPIILACIAGAAINALGTGFPPVIGPMLDIMGRGALPLGLMAVGAGLRWDVAEGAGASLRGAVALSLAAKLVLAPAAAWAACRAFGVGGMELAVAVMFLGLPVSAASYVMARQLGGDGPLMAAIVTWTTLGAAATLPLAVLLAA